MSDQQETIALSNNKYTNEFEVLECINNGTFGEVKMVLDKKSGQTFAVKVIPINEEPNDKESVLGEINIMSQLRSKYTVKFIDAWSEEQSNNTFVYIQMELGLSSLFEFIKGKRKIFKRTGYSIDSNEYSISMKLFRELTECLNYLHQLKPQIIHRDLKPKNVLICDGINGISLKLCDFGLSKILQSSSNSADKGTRIYTAPEVLKSEKYNTSADVYSLCVIFLDLSSLKSLESNWSINECKSKLDQYTDPSIRTSLESLFEVIRSRIFEADYKNRLNCQQLLDEMTKLSIDDHLVSKQANELFAQFISGLKTEMQ